MKAFIINFAHENVNNVHDESRQKRQLIGKEKRISEINIDLEKAFDTVCSLLCESSMNINARKVL